jgi:hypothetical protein
MAVTTELTMMHRTVDELREIITSVHGRYGEIPAARRPRGDTPQDPSLWDGADDEGLGGYHR